MKRKTLALLRRVFCLPPGLTALVALPGLVLCLVLLAVAPDNPLAYAAYAWGAYGLVLLATGGPGLVRAVRGVVRGVPWGEKALTDEDFRATVGVHGGLVMNLAHVAVNVFSAVQLRSLWFAAMAGYYLLLSALRAALAHYMRSHTLGSDQTAELRCCRLCGGLLLLMNQALTFVVIYIVYEGKGFAYPGNLIYAMAAYAFYAVISAEVGIVHTRKRGSPVLVATRVVSLTAALVAILSLETALISRFGGNDGENFRTMMTSVTGSAVCLIVIGMAFGMLRRTTKRLKSCDPVTNNIERK